MQIKKIIFCLALSSASGNVLATSPGPYIGIQLGWADVHQGEFLADQLNKLVRKIYSEANTDAISVAFNNTGLAGRIFAGYQFNNYFAFEMGYFRFTRLDMHADLNVDLVFLNKTNFDFPVDFTGDAAVTTYVVDAVAKGIYPVTDKFSVYGKLGLAYLNSDATISLAAKTSLINLSLSATPSINVVYPEIGLGLNYDLTKNVSGDFSWLHVQRYNSKCYPSIDFLSFGLIYHFG